MGTVDVADGDVKKTLKLTFLSGLNKMHRGCIPLFYVCLNL